MNKQVIFALLIFTASVLTVSAQSHYFTGIINYKITYPAGTSTQMSAALPSTIGMQISGNKARFEMTLPNGKQTFLINGDDMTVTRLLDVAEGKFFIKKTREEIMQGAVPITVPLNDTKTISGYKCKAAEISATDKGGKVQKSTVFYSEELGNNNIYFNTSAKAIKGIMLEFSYNALGVSMQLSADGVNPGRISNNVFDIPSEYQETTEAKLQQLRQANKKK